jgi:hypothetical protein
MQKLLVFLQNESKLQLGLAFFFPFVVFYNLIIFVFHDPCAFLFLCSCFLCIIIIFHALVFHYSHVLLFVCFVIHVLHYSCMFFLHRRSCVSLPLPAPSTSLFLCFGVLVL